MASLNDRFDQFLEHTAELIEKLEKLKTEMQTFHRQVNAARGAGSTVEVVGATATFVGTVVRLIKMWNPQIGYLAEIGMDTIDNIALMGLGGVAAGATSNYIVDVVDKDATIKCMAQIMRLLDEFENVELASMAQIMGFVERVLEKDEEEATVFAAIRLKIELTLRNIQNAANRPEVLDNLDRIVNLKYKIFPQLFAVLTTEKGSEAASEILKFFEKLPLLEKIIKESPSIEKVTQAASVLLFVNLILHIAEMVKAIRSCGREHVTVEVINDIVPKLKSIRRELANMRDQLNAYRCSHKLSPHIMIMA